MTGALFASGRFLIVGANHRSSSLALRDRLFVEDAAIPAFLAGLRESGMRQALVLATCDRVEVLGIDERGDGQPLMTDALARHAGMGGRELVGNLYAFHDADALRHLFAVTAALDSLVLGEPQVLGQVKAAHRHARDCGMVGADLEQALQSAYQVAKRVRSETRLGEGPVSIAAAAVRIARDIHGELDRLTGLLIGGGDMGTLVAEEMARLGLRHLTVVHPSDSRADAIARGLDAHVAPFDRLGEQLAEADIVLAALGTRRHVVSADLVGGALRRRRRRPIFLIDTAIPGDIEPAVNRLDAAFLYDLGDLERVAEDGRADRAAESRRAWGIVDDELAGCLRDRAERAAVPVLTRLREAFEAERARVLAETRGDADKATRLLVNRLLHAPSLAMRDAAAETAAGGEGGPGWEELERAVRRLFALDAPPSAGTGRPRETLR